MSNEIPSPVEFASNPSGKEAVRQALETMSIGPELMHAFAKETMQGAELVGTNLAIDVRKKVSNPGLFSYDYHAAAIAVRDEDGPHHEGIAKIYAATEGVRPMVTAQEEEAEPGAVNTIIKQLLKNHRKGMASIDLKPGDEPVSSKAGKLSPSESKLLANAEKAATEHLLDTVAGSTNPVNQEAALEVAKWVGGKSGEDDGRAIIADIADRMSPMLTQLVALSKQEN